MMNPRDPRHIALVSLLAPALGLAAGCEEKKAPPPPPPPQAVTRAPEPLQIESIIQDKRVQFPQSIAPSDESLSRSVVSFATALAKGDSAALSQLLDAPGKNLLDMQVKSGEWQQATAGLAVVRVVRIDPKGDSADLGIAVQGSSPADGAYLTGWRARQVDGKWTFGGLPVVSRSAPAAADLDGAELAKPAPVVKEEPKPAAPTEPAPPAQPRSAPNKPAAPPPPL